MPRPQFNLRALLILMAVVGGGIVVYRWPWTETKQTAAETITTQYRRGWNGQALRHGLQRISFESSPIVHEDWYEDDELRRNRVLQGSLVYHDQSFRNGKAEGEYIEFGSSSTIKGSYRAGHKHGKWTIGGFEPIVEEHWRDGKLHGLRTWTTAQGRVLQTAEYDNGKLIGWNGQPIAEEVRRWVKANVADERAQRDLLSSTSPRDMPHGRRFGSQYTEMIFRVGESDRPVVVRWTLGRAVPGYLPPGRPITEAILEEALVGSGTLAFRFNTLQVVPITARQLDWQDRTGVKEIRFEPDSREAQHWLSGGKAYTEYWRHPALQLKEIFQQDGAALIEVDTTAVDDLEKNFPRPPAGAQYSSLPHIRRDLVGQTLDHAGYYCELRGKTLVIKPHPDLHNPAPIGPGPK